MSHEQTARIGVFGEVLLDYFPNDKAVLGGAPFNVAWNLRALGQAPYLITRVGRDTQGEHVLATMRAWDMDVSGVQLDAQRPTGRVTVNFDAGEPSYDIVENCAYDAIAQHAHPRFDLLYHGSLAARAEPSASSLRSLRASHGGEVFVDVNLRSPWWQHAQVMGLLRGVHWLKINSDELRLLQGDSRAAAADLLGELQLCGLIVTRGERGAEFLSGGGGSCQVQPEGEVTLADTVGAGDAFASVCLLGLIHGWSMAMTLRRAQDFAQYVVTLQGATTTDREVYRDFRRAWGLS
jgi:fructokinase